ncbi:MAG TPA: hypothetical protein PLU35_10790 [Phycisphaerales bacterium]|nr:hypothetical protein [Phycisphaerales bacterium]
MSDSGEREKPRTPSPVDPDALTRSIPPEALRAADVGAHEIEAHALFESALGPAHDRTTGNVRSLADFYGAWHAAEPDAGHDATALQWRARLAEITDEGGD